MLLSIVVSTFNRPSLLEILLDSLLEQLAQRDDVEIVIVDNHPSLSAQELTENFISAGLPGIYTVESQTGISPARNHGAQIARGKYLLFMDDDASAAAKFVSKICHILETSEPDFFGGPVWPLYHKPPPKWFPELLEKRQYSRESDFIPDARLKGANFGVRKALFHALGGFDNARGMSGSAMGFLEERALLDMYRRTTPQPQKIYYAAECRVYHDTPPARLKLKYQMWRAYRSGKSVAMYFRQLSPSKQATIFGTILFLGLGGIGLECLRAIFSRPRPRRRFYIFCVGIAGKIGFLAGLFVKVHKIIPPENRLRNMVRIVDPAFVEIKHICRKHFVASAGIVRFAKWPGARLVCTLRFVYPWLHIQVERFPPLCKPFLRFLTDNSIRNAG